MKVSIIFCYRMMWILAVIRSGTSSAHKITGRVKYVSICSICVNQTVCTTKEWKSSSTQRRWPRIKTLDGIGQAQRLATTRTESARTKRKLQTVFSDLISRTPSLTSTSMRTTLSTSRIATRIPSQTSPTTSTRSWRILSKHSLRPERLCVRRWRVILWRF